MNLDNFLTIILLKWLEFIFIDRIRFCLLIKI